MKISSFYLSLPLLGAVIVTSGCETSQPKRSAAAPPKAANAPTITVPAAAQPPRIQENLSVRQDPVDALIARVEKEYLKGQANYRAGHLETAKDDFDRAFDMLLQGPVDVHSDERLEREFDKIVEAVNSLEMLALKEGDGFTEQKPEPAPIDEANEATFPVDPNIRAKAEEEVRTTKSDLPLVMNDHVASFISYFSNRGRGTLERALARSGRYREMISRVLSEEGVPQDLIYLAQAESGFHPLALSHAGARGMWQFMASRATGYGLARNWWVDERQDPEKATRAAARHLRDLYNQFGDWYLAMAAYNSGPGTVQRAVQRTGYADFWELYRRDVLPGETRNYVPIIVAVTIMAKNPEQYGLDHITPDSAPTFDKVTISYPVDLRLVAECVDTSVSLLQELNPSLLRLTTPKDQSFDLRLPAGTVDKFQGAIGAIPAEMRVWWRYHKVRPSETLSQIAQKYKTTSKAIAEVNSLEEDDELKRDAKLIIPVAPGRRAASGEETESQAFSRKATRYKVRKGDTVMSVADDFGVPVERLRKWNRLKGNQLRAGRTLSIYKPVAAPEGAGTQVASRSKTKQGSKALVSKKSKPVVDLDDGENDPLPAKSKKVKASVTSAKTSKAQARKVQHKVKAGETLTSIANEYNVSIASLKRDNKKVATNLRAGDVLVINRK
ncbi:MAG TPA: LysM peptidoglycan-binding domain-containing protein [Clostridia bacterium]|nr:LysM peptidoglycan-binding domain-containing protein [Clostridia bacterium]